MKVLLRFHFRWDYTGEAPSQRTDPQGQGQRGSSTEDSDSSDEEIEFDQPADPDVQQARGH